MNITVKLFVIINIISELQEKQPSTYLSVLLLSELMLPIHVTDNDM